jgi:hypothetical protein
MADKSDKIAAGAIGTGYPFIPNFIPIKLKNDLKFV